MKDQVSTRDTPGDSILFGGYKIRDRYLNDQAFRRLVDTLWAIVEQAQYTPTEIRQAAMLAQILYEEHRPPQPITFTREDVMKGKV